MAGLTQESGRGVPGRPPELLAPAGDKDALAAALACGADAVYLGMRRWGARAFAGNFEGDELLGAIDRAHLSGARVYLTLNTLLRDDELGPALDVLAAPYRAGLDAVLVADVGLAASIRDRYPDLALHASTQMDTHSSAQLAFLARLGVGRAVLARELSLREIAALDAHGLELEVFVHGALCYGYSGLCLFSSMVGGRSGNRGRCAQACRMRYRLALEEAGLAPDGTPPVEGRVLSSSDLAAIDVLPDLIEAGVSAFKIEGRMKDPAYVATAVSVYREAVDAAWRDPQGYTVRPEWRERLEQSFSRTFTAAHLRGRHAEVRSGGRSGHRGTLVGRVESVDLDSGQVSIRLSRPVAAGDVVSIYTVQGQTKPVRLSQDGRELMPLQVPEVVSVRDRVFRLTSAEIEQAARDAVAGRRTARPVLLAGVLAGEVGAPARLDLRIAETWRRAAAATVESAQPLQSARMSPLTEERARQAVGALGGTPYELSDFQFAVAGDAYLPVAELRALRRQALALIDEARLAAHRRQSSSESAPRRTRASGRANAAGEPGPAAAAAGLAVVVRRRLGTPTLTGPGVVAICLDLAVDDDPSIVRTELERLHDQSVPVRCRPPAVLLDGDHAWWESVGSLSWDAVYARHASHLETAAGVIPEYPLQGLDSATALSLCQAGIVRDLVGVLPSPELALDQLRELSRALQRSPARPALEILVFGRQELLVTRDLLGVSEGLLPTPGKGERVRLCLEDAKGFRFPVTVSATDTRIANAHITDLTGHESELLAAGVTVAVLDAEELDAEARRAFARGGLAGLAQLVDRERSTTGHLYRGVE